MGRLLRWAGGLAIVASVGYGAGAQQVPANPAEELIRLERARQTLESALDRFLNGEFSSTAARHYAMVEMAYELRSAGPDMVPALIDELEQAKRSNFQFMAYSLGLFDTPEARQALRRVIARADSENGDFATFCKRTAAYALGLTGEVEAIRLVNTGRHITGHSAVHSGVSTLGAVALQTAPESVPVLLAELDRLTETEEQQQQRFFIVRALGRLGDSRGVPALLELLAEDPPNHRLRFRAVRALARIGSPEAVEAVLAALADSDSHVRTRAAVDLESLRPEGSLPRLMRRLEEEPEPGIRGRLYRVVAAVGGVSSLETLAGAQDRPDIEERLHVITAVSSLQEPKAVPMLTAALNDPANDVAMEAIRGLSRIGTREATDRVIGQLASPAWPRATTALSALVRAEKTESAEAIARRLFEVELGETIRSPDQRSRATELLRALVVLGYHEALDKLREVTERQSDATLLQSIADTTAELELIERNGKDVKRWVATLDAARPEHRKLAYRHLGRIGSTAAARALVSRFGRVEVNEGVEIFKALGRVDRAPSRELIRRVLVSPEFDVFERLALRDAAAWAARLLGDPEMFETLKAAALRRDGRDVRVLIYAAIIGRESALPLLSELRVVRMRYLDWLRGNELDVLDRIARVISQGREVREYDVPPERLDFR